MKESVRKIMPKLKGNLPLILIVVFMLLVLKQLLTVIVLYQKGVLVQHILVELVLTTLIIGGIFIMIQLLLKAKYTLLESKGSVLKKEKDSLEKEVGRLQKVVDDLSNVLDREEESDEELKHKIKGRLIKGQKKDEVLTIETFFKRICLTLEIGVGVLYQRHKESLDCISSFGLEPEKEINYLLDEGIIGAVAKTSESIKLCNLPDSYFEAYSGLGKSMPHFLHVFPLAIESGDVERIIEVGTYSELLDNEIKVVQELYIDFFGSN